MTAYAEPIGPHDVLVHVGPHKTGTSAIQGALAAARPQLVEHDVLYPGPGRSQAAAARAASGFASTTGLKLPSRRHWDDLVDQVAGAPGRVVISSEFLDVVEPDLGRRLVSDLGQGRVHVVVTAAPLTSILVSTWQQSVRSKLRAPLEDWLRATFEQPQKRDPATFWKRQRIDHQLERWSSVVGADRVQLLVTDKLEPQRLFATFEQLLGLPDGLLVPRRSSANRSFTLEEAELVRRVNRALVERGWGVATHARFVRLGAVRAIGRRTPPADEPRITLPSWAVERANDVAREMITGIAASGVHVIGDPGALVGSPPTVDEQPEVTRVDIDLAVRAILGTMHAGGAGILQENFVTAADLKKYPGISSAPTDLLRAELTRRARARLRATFRR